MPNSNRPIRHITLTLALCCAGGVLVAQTSGGRSTVPPYNPPTVYTPTKMNLYTSFCGLWRTDQSYASTIRLSNQLSISPMDATVTLYMKDGTPYVLAPVHLQTSGVATVNVNTALSGAPASIQPHLSSFGSASVSYRYDWQGVVFASMSIMDTVRSLEYTYPFMFPMAEQMGAGASAGAMNSTTLEGLHWGYSAQSSVFLSLSNATQQPLNVSLSLLDGDGNVTVGESLVIPSLNTVLMTGLPTSTTPGGVQVAWNGDEDALAVLGGIEDAKYGYSENVRFAAVPASGPAGPTTVQTTLASPGIMVGAQDPMMGFPANLSFQPYGYFRNIGGQPMTLSGQIFYTKGGQAGSLPLPATALPPHSSLSLPLQSMIQGLGLNGAITLVVSYSGQAGALLASTGSVDTTGNYVFAVPAHAAAASAGKTSVFWTTANGFDTMYSIWNPASQAQPLLATFQLGNGQTYLYPVTVPALGTAMIDVKEIAAMGTPDSNGNTLPLSVTQGRVSFSAASGNPTDPMNVVIGGGIYNPAKAVCGNTCETCDGCCSFQITPDPATVPAGVLTQLYVQCPWTTGALYDYTESSSWSSGNSSVVEFESPGLASPVDPGSTTVAAQMPSVPVSQGQICTEGSLPACQYASPKPTGPVTVVNVTLTCDSPSLALGSPLSAAPPDETFGSCTATGSPAGGTYSWSASKSTITISGNGASATYTAASASSAVGDTTITVTYTYQGNNPVSATSSAITVYQPASLSGSTVTQSGTQQYTLTCLASPGTGSCNVVTTGQQCSYTGPIFTRNYNVVSQISGVTFASVNLSLNVAESVQIPPGSNGCLISNPILGTTAGSSFTDTIGIYSTCCETGGPGCTTTTNQTITVNGFSMAQETITTTCTTASVAP